MKRFIDIPGSGAIKARRSHFWSQSHFSSIYSFTESEIEIKSEIVSIFMALEPERSKCLVVTTIPSPISSSGKIMVQSGQDE